MDIQIQGINKQFGSFTALGNIDLTIAEGELVALLGPSGSGKTTLLRIIAGLEQPTSGSILFGGEDLIGQSLRERQVGFVFQHYALFRHMRVFDNVAFGLRVKKRRERRPESEIRDRVMRLLRLVQLEPFAHRYPSQLSGGQRQRVALARALAIEPRVLLLDEPFGALDAKVRKELRRWLRRLHDEVHVTSVFVTHDQEEALEVADRVVVMNHGRIEQVGPPDEVYDRPATPFVLQFLGDVNLFHGRAAHPPGSASGLAEGEVGYVRPHELEVVAQPGDGTVSAELLQTFTVGPRTRLEFRHPGGDGVLAVEMLRGDYVALRERLALQPGARCHLRPRRLERLAAGTPAR